jgi:hypothetical protein
VRSQELEGSRAGRFLIGTLLPCKDGIGWKFWGLPSGRSCSGIPGDLFVAVLLLLSQFQSHA